MTSKFSFIPSDEVTSIRNRINHPVVDGDGHLVEFMPLVVDILGEIAGKSAASDLSKFFEEFLNPNNPAFQGARVHWGLPEENTLDRMTVTLPKLTYDRMDQMGLDFALLYPSFGLVVLGIEDEELRQSCARACNTYFARLYSEFGDKLAPVAIIPSFTPDEAIAEMDFAIGELGLKAMVTSAIIPRKNQTNGNEKSWIDTLGHESAYDYDPLWAKCVEYGVVPAFHALGYGWGTRNSSKNYVYNHLGNFASAQEAACRSLFIAGVPKRFPEMRFSFLEGGVGWAAQLYADILGHYVKRNKDVVERYDPRRFDTELCAELLDEFASEPITNLRQHYEANAKRLTALPPENIEDHDDFSESLITSEEDIVDIFTRQYYFGCEADDPLNALAFQGSMLPHKARLNAMFASDIGHWDVPDMRNVLPEAWELVEDGHINEDDFKDFSCGNVVKMLTSMNPDFFKDTVIEDTAKSYQS